MPNRNKINIEIHPLSPSAIPAAVTLYFASFASNLHSLACFPRHHPAVRGWWEAMFRSELGDPDAHWLAVTTTPTAEDKAVDAASPRLMAFAKWVRPRPLDAPSYEDEFRDAPPQWPEGGDARLCEETFGAWARAHTRLMRGRAHWYLEILAVAPEFQGRGIGTALVAWGCARADEQGTAAFLEASPEAVRVFERVGFGAAESVETWIAAAGEGEEEGEGKGKGEGEWYRNVFMVREPRQNEDSGFGVSRG